jgi:hypothetical protein
MFGPTVQHVKDASDQPSRRRCQQIPRKATQPSRCEPPTYRLTKRKTGLAGGRAEAFVTAAVTLARQGDLALALDIVAPGLLQHPDSSELAELRQAVLVRLMEERQLLDPFGFTVYAQLTGAELSPVG